MSWPNPPSVAQFVGAAKLFPDMPAPVLTTMFWDTDYALLPPTTGWDQVANVLAAHRLAGTALRICRGFPTNISAESITQLRNASFRSISATAGSRTASVEAIASLAAANVPSVILKGPGIAEHYPHPAERPYCDLDVFVRKEDFKSAMVILAADGYSEGVASRQPWQALQWATREAVNLRSPSGGSIDLHHTIPPWLWGRPIRFADIYRRSVARTFSGFDVRVASPEDNLVIACLHVVSDHNSPGATLIIWRDIAMLAASIDRSRFAATVGELGLGGWVAWVFANMPEGTLAVDLVQEITSLNQQIPHVRRLTMLLPPHIGSRHLLSQVLRLPPSRALLYLGGVLAPSHDFLEVLMPEEHSALRRRAHWSRDVIARFMAAGRPERPSSLHRHQT